MSQVIIEKDRMGVERRYIEKFAKFYLGMNNGCDMFLHDTQNFSPDPLPHFKVRIEIPRELWDVPVIEAEVIKP